MRGDSHARFCESLKVQFFWATRPLPRKFNTGLTGSLANRCNVFGQDCCFVLAQKEGVYGYNMYLGGRVGKIAQNADIFLKDDEEVLAAFKSITELFRRYPQ